jgi:hypothetical protein
LNNSSSDTQEESSREGFALFVGAGFSLWRAAFLSGIERSWPEIIEKGSSLLETVLLTNAVSFATDRSVRNWMMGYYPNNARFRLADAVERLGASKNTDAFSEFAKIHPRGITNVDLLPTRLWDVLLRMFRELLTVLRTRTGAKPTTTGLT